MKLYYATWSDDAMEILAHGFEDRVHDSGDTPIRRDGTPVAEFGVVAREMPPEICEPDWLTLEMTITESEADLAQYLEDPPKRSKRDAWKPLEQSWWLPAALLNRGTVHLLEAQESYQ